MSDFEKMMMEYAFWYRHHIIKASEMSAFEQPSSDPRASPPGLASVPSPLESPASKRPRVDVPPTPVAGSSTDASKKTTATQTSFPSYVSVSPHVAPTVSPHPAHRPTSLLRPYTMSSSHTSHHVPVRAHSRSPPSQHHPYRRSTASPTDNFGQYHSKTSPLRSQYSPSSPTSPSQAGSSQQPLNLSLPTSSSSRPAAGVAPPPPGSRMTIVTTVPYMVTAGRVVRGCWEKDGGMPTEAEIDDPVVEEHFRRSLGEKYEEVIKSPTSSSPPTSRMSPAEPRAADKIAVIAPTSRHRPPSTGSSQAVHITDNSTVDDHFAKSLGAKWTELNRREQVQTAVAAEPESVDDHFTKALGETWLKIKADRRGSSSSASTPSTPTAPSLPGVGEKGNNC